jgi:1-acyl-sn-glycerol-3-phosphate acyltransferase
MQPIVFNPPKASSNQASSLYGLRLIWAGISESVRFLTAVICHGVNRQMADRHIKQFAERLLTVTHTSLEVLGADRLDPARSYVYMSNHESMLDIPVGLRAAPGSTRMIAKQELFKVPFFGRAMLRAGFIPIDRKDLEKAKQQLEEAKSHLKEGVSLWIFPEGTRSRTLELLPFKKGGFHVALALGAPIVPVWIEGAGKVLLSDTLKVVPNLTIRVHFGCPIETSGKNLPDLMTEVRQAIEMSR